MLYTLLLIGLTVPLVALLDLLWLGLIAKNLYQSMLSHLLGPVVWPAAVLFYVMYAAGIVIFAVLPGINQGLWYKTALLGALFGFFCYATYDLTNWATLREWPVTIVLVDILWGMFLTTSVASASYWIAKTWL